MLDHLSITTADLDRAQRFYDAVLSALGYPRVYRSERGIGYGERGAAGGYISVFRSENVVADNRHWAFRAPSRAAVRAFYEAALAQGGRDDGPPGLRPEYNPTYYAAFVLDPDGNRIEAVCREPGE
ncbi:VOC family protein [Reyranella sp. CPCC 100927]|uniref:VOC family protein n=1 Tax=Reyranella sp. CPCC 100927 TaxID=2599616 RepID=UPI0011B6FD2E|nr:VOC family protein [Reyranella sp. CPCC 100927]TWT12840.1 VOC family protein [Reyranella sp. CPCC 100927]